MPSNRGVEAHGFGKRHSRGIQEGASFIMDSLPRVGLILTGGTIDSVGVDRLDLAWYMEANKRLGDGELLSQLPELKQIARVQEIPFRRLPSQALVDKDWLDLVRNIHSILDID